MAWYFLFPLIGPTFAALNSWKPRTKTNIFVKAAAMLLSETTAMSVAKGFKNRPTVLSERS